MSGRDTSTLVAAMALASVSWLAGEGAHALVILQGCAGGPYGDSCSLGELAAGGSISIDDTRFDGWEFSTGGSNTTIDADDIRVDPIGLGTATVGVRFSAFGDAWETFDQRLVVDNLTYTVSDVRGRDTIVGAELELTSVFVSDADNLVQVAETLTGIGSLNVVYDPPFFSERLDVETFTPASRVEASTLVEVLGFSPGAVELDTFEQRFRLVAAPAACSVAVTPTFDGRSLTLAFDLATSRAVKWNVWLSIGPASIPVFSVSLPALEPGTSLSVPVLRLPPLGTFGVLTTMTRPGEGILCSDWKIVRSARAARGNGAQAR